jgi:hypothetical protein
MVLERLIEAREGRGSVFERACRFALENALSS